MIVDASAAVPLLIDHPMTDAARKALHGRQLASPAIMLVEVANALWTHAIRGGIAAGEASSILGKLPKLVDIEPDGSLLENAVGLAIANRHPVCDCLYLALAAARREPLATADRKLAALARNLSIETELIEPAP